MDSQIYKSSSISKAFEAPENSEVTELDSKKVLADKILIETNQDGSTSVLDKLFDSTLTPNGGGPTNLTSTAVETWAPGTSHSSKLAHIFLDEEKKPVGDLSTDMPKDLLTLIQVGEKGVPMFPIG